MANFFKDILLPVDLSINTEIAIKKALEFADNGTNIHLFHVLRYSKTDFGSMIQRYFYEPTARPEYMRAEIKMNQWRDCIIKSKNNVTVSVWIAEENSIQKAIENKAIEVNVDLILLIKNSHHSLLPFLNTVNPAQLSQNTGTIVLSIKGKVDSKSKAMVVPITIDTTTREKELIYMICRRFISKIYLVTFITNEREPMNSNASSLLQVYKWLKTIHLNVEYAALREPNKAKALINYAASVNAETLLFHSKTETKIDARKKKVIDLWQNKSEYIIGAG